MQMLFQADQVLVLMLITFMALGPWVAAIKSVKSVLIWGPAEKLFIKNDQLF